MTGADIAARALSTVGRGWVYQLGAKPPASVPAGAASVPADCTGFAWWAAGKRQSGRIRPPSWQPIAAPRIGAVVWHSADPGKTFGHVGVVVAVYPNGDFDSADCSSTLPGPRGGAIRIVRRARAFWARSAGAWGFDWPTWAQPGGGSTWPLALAGAAALALLVRRAGVRNVRG